jgi:MFS family permease
VGKKWGALLAVSLASFMLLINFMTVSVSLPAIRHSLGASLPDLQWVLEAFVLTIAVFVLSAGYVADREGRRSVFLIGIAVFLLGSLLGAFAPSPAALIGARVVQGFGGAMLFATGPTLLTQVARGSTGKLALAVWGLLTGLAVGLSPGIGGLVTSQLGWRWMFLLNLPIGAAAFLVGIIATKEPLLGASTSRAGPELAYGEQRAPHGREGHHDWHGHALFTSAIAILVIGLVRTTQTSWSQSGVLACFACTGLLLVAFVGVEATQADPMLDISLFRRRTFTGSAIAAFGLSMAVWGAFMFLVLYMADGLGYSVGALSLRLLLLTGMTVPFLPIASWLDHHLPLRALVCAGLVLVAGGFWLMSRSSVTNTWSDMAPGLALAGIGLELVNPRLASAAAATVRPELAAVASRTSSALRQVGAAVGVAVLGSIFATRLSDDITRGLSGLPGLADQTPQIISWVTQGRTARALAEIAPGLRSGVSPVIKQSIFDATHEVLLVAAVVALASGLMALLIRSADVPVVVEASPACAEVASPALAPAPMSAAPVTPSPGRPGAQNGYTPATPQDSPAPVTPQEGAPHTLEAVVPATHQELVPAAFDHQAPELSGDQPPAVTRHEPHVPNQDHVLNGPGARASWQALARLLAPRDASRSPNGPDEGGASERKSGEGGAGETWRDDLARTPFDSTAAHGDLCGQITEVSGNPVAGATVARVGAGSLSGVVRRARDGSPLVAEIALSRPDGTLMAQRSTRENGRFAIWDLAEGSYILRARLDGYQDELRHITVPRGGSVGTEMKMVGVGHIYGAITGPRGGWLAAVPVALRDETGASMTTTNTDSAGSYHFANVPEGSYQVVVKGAAVVRVEVEGGKAVAADITLGTIG